MKKFPEALAFIERQVTAQRHAGQVTDVQRLGKSARPADVSAVIKRKQLISSEDSVDSLAHAQLGVLRKGAEGGGKGGTAVKTGPPQGKHGQRQTRKCYNCGHIGHWAADCHEPPQKDVRGGKGGQKERRINSVRSCRRRRSSSRKYGRGSPLCGARTWSGVRLCSLSCEHEACLVDVVLASST